MSMKISFNDWLLGTAHPNNTAASSLATPWRRQRGRLTRASVEKRAQLTYGLPAGIGIAAWDAYVAQVLPVATPPGEDTQPTTTEGQSYDLFQQR
jgi:hypothetical protein